MLPGHIHAVARLVGLLRAGEQSAEQAFGRIAGRLSASQFAHALPSLRAIAADEARHDRLLARAARAIDGEWFASRRATFLHAPGKPGPKNPSLSYRFTRWRRLPTAVGRAFQEARHGAQNFAASGSRDARDNSCELEEAMHGIPRILSINAGFMDTAAFLALKGMQRVSKRGTASSV
jgi:hypothetical protein